MARIKLISIACHDQQDWLGSDEPYLLVNGRRVWSGKEVDRGAHICLEGEPEAGFFGTARVQLFESDGAVEEGEASAAEDDLLGEWVIRDELVGKGEQKLDFDRNGAHYELRFLVFP